MYAVQISTRDGWLFPLIHLHCAHAWIAECIFIASKKVVFLLYYFWKTSCHLVFVTYSTLTNNFDVHNYNINIKSKRVIRVHKEVFTNLIQSIIQTENCSPIIKIFFLQWRPLPIKIYTGDSNGVNSRIFHSGNFCWPTEKREARKRGKIENKRRKIVKGKVENWKRIWKYENG